MRHLSHPAKFGIIMLLFLAFDATVVLSQESAWDTVALRQIDPAEMGYLTHSTLLVDGSGTIIWS